MKRRKRWRYRTMKGNSGVKFLGFVGIMVGAVICGYLTARFVVAPLLGYETEVLKLEFPSGLTSLMDIGSDGEDDGQTTDEEDGDNDAEKSDAESASGTQDSQAEDAAVENSAAEDTAKGYALQFGVFSAKSSAEDLVDKLKKENIDARVKEIDGQYKVLSETFDTKEKALKELETLKDEQEIDVFITVMN